MYAIRAKQAKKSPGNTKSSSTTKKERKSVFFLTINPLNPHSTMRSYEGGEDGLRTKLQAACRAFDEPHVERFVYFATKAVPLHTYATHILKHSNQHEIEDGATRSVGLHAHLIVSFTHNSNIRLNFIAIRNFLNKLFGHKIHFNCDVVKGQNSISDLKSYIKKNKTKIDSAAASSATEI
jgi:hypothetical protein